MVDGFTLYCAHTYKQINEIYESLVWRRQTIEIIKFDIEAFATDAATAARWGRCRMRFQSFSCQNDGTFFAHPFGSPFEW